MNPVKLIKTPNIASGGTYQVVKGKVKQTRQPDHSQNEWSEPGRTGDSPKKQPMPKNRQINKEK